MRACACVCVRARACVFLCVHVRVLGRCRAIENTEDSTSSFGDGTDTLALTLALSGRNHRFASAVMRGNAHMADELEVGSNTNGARVRTRRWTGETVPSLLSCEMGLGFRI